jgi:hypothetical protein
MKQIRTAAILIFFSIMTPASAIPVYVGMHPGETAANATVGYRLNASYSIEGDCYRSDSQVSHAGVPIDTNKFGTGIAGIAYFQKKLRDVLPYFLFVKAGYERTTSVETYSIPSSVMLTLPYSGTLRNAADQVVAGGGADYDFTRSIKGRVGMDFVGTGKDINLDVIYQV